jgi:ribosomal protein S18 acetylase RimI-like enzyme
MNNRGGKVIQIEHRYATVDDSADLAELNRQFLLEEGHRSVFLPGLGETMESIPLQKLEERMSRWLSGAFRAVIFSQREDVVAYALFREDEYELHVQQFFVLPSFRRQGIGTHCFSILRSEYWPGDKRLSLEVETENQPALAFWHAMGYRDYAIYMEIRPDG